SRSPPSPTRSCSCPRPHRGAARTAGTVSAGPSRPRPAARGSRSRPRTTKAARRAACPSSSSTHLRRRASEAGREGVLAPRAARRRRRDGSGGRRAVRLAARAGAARACAGGRRHRGRGAPALRLRALWRAPAATAQRRHMPLRARVRGSPRDTRLRASLRRLRGGDPRQLPRRAHTRPGQGLGPGAPRRLRRPAAAAHRHRPGTRGVRGRAGRARRAVGARRGPASARGVGGAALRERDVRAHRRRAALPPGRWRPAAPDHRVARRRRERPPAARRHRRPDARPGARSGRRRPRRRGGPGLRTPLRRPASPRAAERRCARRRAVSPPRATVRPGLRRRARPHVRRPASPGDRGFALLLALLVLLALGTLGTGLLFVSTQEARVSRALVHAVRARSAAESAARAALAGWDAAAYGHLAPGAAADAALPPGAFGPDVAPAARIERLAGGLFLIRAEARSGPPSGAGARASVGLLAHALRPADFAPDFAAALSAAGPVELLTGAVVDGTGSAGPPAGWAPSDCPPDSVLGAPAGPRPG